MNNPVSIDKIVLQTQDFEVNSKNKLLVKSGTLDNETGEFLNDYILYSGNDVHINGSSAYRNSDNCRIDINRNGLLVTFNPAKIIGQEHNFYPVDYSQTLSSLKTVTDDAEECGVRFSMDDATIHRLDVQKTVQTKYPFFYYNPVFSTMDAKRMNGFSYGTGYSFRNKSREVTAYDKINEMRTVHKIDTSNISGDWMRCEYKMRKKNVVIKDAKISKLCHIKDSNIFQSLADVYKQKVSEIVFREENTGDNSTFNFDQEVELLKHFKETTGRNAVYQYLLTFVLDDVKRHFMDVDELYKIISQVYTERHARKIKNTMFDKIRYSVRGRRREITVSELYGELHQKLVA